MILSKYWINYNKNKLFYMNLAIFCTQLTFDLILRLGVIFRLGIHPSVFSYILRNTFSMDAKMYSKMPTEIFFGSSDCLLSESCVKTDRGFRKTIFFSFTATGVDCMYEISYNYIETRHGS